MVSSFPHGVTIRQAPANPQAVITLDSERLFFVGTAPVMKADPASVSINQLQQVRSLNEANTKFGTRTHGYSIPEFYWVISQYNAREAYFVNVFDPERHTGTTHQVVEFDATDAITLGDLLEFNASSLVVSDAVQVGPSVESWVSSEIDTGESAISQVKITDTAGTVIYEEGRDYTVTGGVITATSFGRIDTNSDASVSYVHAAAVPLVLDTNYSLSLTAATDPETGDPYPTSYSYGAVELTGLTKSEGDMVFISYTSADPKFVTASDIIGNDTSFGKTGLQLVSAMRGAFGFDATHITADLHTESTVAAELETLANRFRAQYHVTIPRRATVSEALEGRAGTDGYVKNAFTQDPRAVLYADYIAAELQGQAVYHPLHWHGMGARVITTRERGFWWSISSYPLQSALGVEMSRTLSRTDLTADNQQLSEVGSYVTVYREFGSGFMLDGNHNASYPTMVDGTQFHAVQNARDTILRSLARSAQSALDKPLSRVVAESLEGRFNTYLTSISNPDRAQGPAIGQASSASIDIPDNTVAEQRLGRLYVLCQIAYFTPINTIILIEDPIEVNIFG